MRFFEDEADDDADGGEELEEDDDAERESVIGGEDVVDHGDDEAEVQCVAFHEQIGTAAAMSKYKDEFLRVFGRARQPRVLGLGKNKRRKEEEHCQMT